MRWAVIVTLAACGGGATRAPTPLPIVVEKPAEPGRPAPRNDEAMCTRGDSAACMTAARRYQAGFAVARDVVRAKELWKRACDAGLGEACMELALIDEDKREALTERAHALEIERCRSGTPEACLVANDTGFVAEDVWREALAALDDGCRGGVAVQCRALARVYLQGLRVTPRDQPRAVALLKRGCEVGDADACADAALFSDGDEERALNEKGCMLGAGYSCRQLAEALHEKRLDPVRAQALYRQACDAGDEIACGWLVAYLEGEHGGKADAAAAIVLRHRSCLRGNPFDCTALAETAEAAHDLPRAQRFFSLACNAGETVHGCVPELRVIAASCGDAATCPAVDARLATLHESQRDIASYLCCHDPDAPPANPTAAVFALRDAIDTRDPKRLEPHVHPRRGLSVRVGWHGPDGASETKKVVKRTAIDLDPFERALAFHRDRIECTTPEKGEASCSVFEGGFVATYRVLVEKGRAHVIEIDEESH